MKYLILIFLLFPTIVSASLIDDVNAVREVPVERDLHLDLVATAKAVDMILNDYWAHENNGDIWHFFRKYRYPFAQAGEVLARNYESDDQIIRGWLNSPTHKKVILDSIYNKAGYAQVGNITVLVFAQDWTSSINQRLNDLEKKFNSL